MNEIYNSNSISKLKNILQTKPKAWLYVKNEWSGVFEDLHEYNNNDEVAKEICGMVIMDLIEEEIITSI